MPVKSLTQPHHSSDSEPCACRARPGLFTQRVSRAEAEAAVHALISWAGDDPMRDGLHATPTRVVRAYEEWFAEYALTPANILEWTFGEVAGSDDLALLRDIRFESFCEHHMAPKMDHDPSCVRLLASAVADAPAGTQCKGWRFQPSFGFPPPEGASQGGERLETNPGTADVTSVNGVRMSSQRPAASAHTLILEERAGHIAVERALVELRAGRPVLLEDGSDRALVLGAEALDTESAARMAASAPLRTRLALTAPRLTRLGQPRTLPGTIALSGADPERVETLALQVEARIDAPVTGAEPLDVGGLELLRLALVLPAAVVAPVEAGATESDALRVALEDVLAHRGRQVRSLRIVGRAPVPLEGAPKTEFVVFRGGEGLRDQVAVVVGSPDLSRPVPVRLHSACLTGDLFGSLKCDCGDQLRDTVARMASGAGGILLYLDQEGRGNGIANKMRAYKLQSEGMDTYDADEVLGFGLDQRRFDFAAQMLRMLGVEKVELHTNNPEKIAALKAAGLTVAAEARVLGRPTQENVRYLAAKRDRAGHHIDFDALAARISE